MPTYRTPHVPSGHRATPPLAIGDRRNARGRSLLSVLSAAALCVCLASPLAAQQVVASASGVQQANARLTQAAQSGSPATLQTRALLTARHADLVQVFRDASASVRSYALPAATRDALLKAEPSFARLIEQERSVKPALWTLDTRSFWIQLPQHHLLTLTTPACKAEAPGPIRIRFSQSSP